MAHGVHPREQPLQTHACDVALGCAAAQCAESEMLQQRRSPMRVTGHDCMNCMVLPDGGSGESSLVGPEGCESVSVLRGLPLRRGRQPAGPSERRTPAHSRVNLELRKPRQQRTWNEGCRRGKGNKRHVDSKPLGPCSRSAHAPSWTHLLRACIQYLGRAIRQSREQEGIGAIRLPKISRAAVDRGVRNRATPQRTSTAEMLYLRGFRYAGPHMTNPSRIA